MEQIQTWVKTHRMPFGLFVASVVVAMLGFGVTMLSALVAVVSPKINVSFGTFQPAIFGVLIGGIVACVAFLKLSREERWVRMSYEQKRAIEEQNEVKRVEYRTLTKGLGFGLLGGVIAGVIGAVVMMIVAFVSRDLPTFAAVLRLFVVTVLSGAAIGLLAALLIVRHRRHAAMTSEEESEEEPVRLERKPLSVTGKRLLVLVLFLTAVLMMVLASNVIFYDFHVTVGSFWVGGHTWFVVLMLVLLGFFVRDVFLVVHRLYCWVNNKSVRYMSRKDRQIAALRTELVQTQAELSEKSEKLETAEQLLRDNFIEMPVVQSQEETIFS